MSLSMCPVCGGSGEITRAMFEWENIQTEFAVCPTCDGRGWMQWSTPSQKIDFKAAMEAAVQAFNAGKVSHEYATRTRR